MNEKEMNLAIYNKLADHAREVFNHLDGTTMGKNYTPADIAATITGGPVVGDLNRENAVTIEPYKIGSGLSWAEGYDPATVYEVAVASFSCRVTGWKIFAVLAKVATAYSIPTAARVTFRRENAAPVVASFTLATTDARELAAACASDKLRPVMEGVLLDTRRRVLVASDGHLLKVVQLADALTVSDTAAASYIIPAAVLKSGRVVTITADDIASTDTAAAPVIAGRFPNWAAVLSSYIVPQYHPESNGHSMAGRLPLTAAEWKTFKKAVADVAKIHHADKWHPARVSIAHDLNAAAVVVYAIDRDFNNEREIVVKIAAASDAREFAIDIDAKQFAKLSTAAALYFCDSAAPLLMENEGGASLLLPLQQADGDKYAKHCHIDPQGDRPDLLPGLDIAAAAADIASDYEHDAARYVLRHFADESDDLKADDLAHVLNCSNDHARELLAAVAADDSESNAPDTTTTADSTAAPAADGSDIDTPTPSAESDTTNESAPALTLPPLAALLTTDSPAPLLAITTARPVLLLPVLTSESDTTPTAESTAAPCWSSPFATLPELPDIDTPTPSAESDSSAPDLLPLLTIDTAAGVIIWGRPADSIDTDESDTAAPAADGSNDSRRPLLLSWIARAAAVLLLVVLSSLTATNDDSDRPALASFGRISTAGSTTAAPVLTFAAPAADDIESTTTPESDTTTTAAPVLAIYEPLTATTAAAPAADRATTGKRHHARENKRQRHRAPAVLPDTLTAAPVLAIAAPADVIESDSTTAAPADGSDLLTVAAVLPDTITTATPDTLTAAPVLAIAAPAADVIESDTTTTAESTAAPADGSDIDAPSSDSIESTTTTPESDTAAPAADGSDIGAPTPSAGSTTAAPVVLLSPVVTVAAPAGWFPYVIASF